MREAFGDSLFNLAKCNQLIVVLDADVGNSTKTEIIATQLERQFIEMGIAESNMIGVAAGLAAVGYMPWVVTFAVFLVNRGLDQIRQEIAQTHANVKLVGAYAGLSGGFVGKTHHAVNDVAILRSLPGMLIAEPADPSEVTEVLSEACEYDGPIYIRLNRNSAGDCPNRRRFRFGEGSELREGLSGVIISTGVQTVRCSRALESLERDGYSIGLVHIPSIKPFPNAMIREMARKYRRILVVEEHSIIGGLGEAVATAIAESNCTAEVSLAGIPDEDTFSASSDELLEHYGLDGLSLRRRIVDYLVR